MKAIIVNEGSEQREMLWSEVQEPVPGPEEVLLEVHAAGVNRADLLQRAGKYPPPQGVSSIMGLEAAGQIVSVGSRVVDWKVGQRVCALLPGGGYAERVVAHTGSIMPLPAKASYEEGAAIPEAFITAFVNLFYEADLRSGECVLIHGGSSGVGTAAIQLARSVGARVAVTVGSEEKVERCLDLGADRAVNYKTSPFTDEVRAWAGEFGIDVILDCIGGSYFAQNVALLGLGGRLVVIGTMGGSKAEIDLSQLMRKRARVQGSVLRTRTSAEKAELVRLFSERFWSLLEFRNIYPVIHSSFPVTKVQDAHDLMVSSQHVGKIILKIR